MEKVLKHIIVLRKWMLISFLFLLTFYVYGGGIGCLMFITWCNNIAPGTKANWKEFLKKKTNRIYEEKLMQFGTMWKFALFFLSQCLQFAPLNFVVINFRVVFGAQSLVVVVVVVAGNSHITWENWPSNCCLISQYH